MSAAPAERSKRNEVGSGPTANHPRMNIVVTGASRGIGLALAACFGANNTCLRRQCAAVVTFGQRRVPVSTAAHDAG